MASGVCQGLPLGSGAPVNVYADPTTHALLVQSGGSPSDADVLWVSTKTWAAASADGHASVPADAAFKTCASRSCFITFGTGDTGVTFPSVPTSAEFWVWAWYNDGATARKEVIAKYVVPGTASGYIQPLVVENCYAKIAVTLDAFTGGTVPTITGTVMIRPVKGSV